MALLNLRIPKDPVDAVAYLDEVEETVAGLIAEAHAEAYFTARLDGRFEEALEVGRTSRKRALRLVRWMNNRAGRSIRWGDGADPGHS